MPVKQLSKRVLLGRAAEEGWTVVFEHDANVAWGRVAHDRKSYTLTPLTAP